MIRSRKSSKSDDEDVKKEKEKSERLNLSLKATLNAKNLTPPKKKQFNPIRYEERCI